MFLKSCLSFYSFLKESGFADSKSCTHAFTLQLCVRLCVLFVELYACVSACVCVVCAYVCVMTPWLGLQAFSTGTRWPIVSCPSFLLSFLTPSFHALALLCAPQGRLSRWHCCRLLIHPLLPTYLMNTHTYTNTHSCLRTSSLCQPVCTF